MPNMYHCTNLLVFIEGVRVRRALDLPERKSWRSALICSTWVCRRSRLLGTIPWKRMLSYQ